MLKSCFVFLQFVLVGISVWTVYCYTEEQESEILKAVKPIALECIEDCGLTEEDIKEQKPKDIPPCIKICFLKKIGLLNEDGKYDRNAVKEQVLTYTDDEEEANKVQSALDDCIKDKEEELKDDKDTEEKQADIIYRCLKNMKE